MLDSLNRFISCMSAPKRGAACVGLIGVLGVVDYATGYELSFSIFYLVPVGISAWYGGRKLGLWMALLSVFVWLYVDLATGHQYENTIIPFWNASVRLGFFVIVAHLLAAQRQTLLRETENARIDALTGARNTKGFLEAAEVLWNLATRHGHPTSLAYLDLDNFKSVNDAHGHAEGDAVLQAVAATLSESLRRSDILGRLGGDEFAVLLPETPREGTAQVLRAAHNGVLRLAQERGWPITMSIGAVVLSPNNMPLEQALREADALMYRAKRAGKNRVLIEEHSGQSKLTHQAPEDTTRNRTEPPMAAGI